MDVPILPMRKMKWYCPNCTMTDITYRNDVHTQMHACKGMNGLLAPMTEFGVKAKVEAVERDDYINGEHVTYDGEGRPIMSVITTRDEGQDTAVYAPVATASHD